MTKPARLRTFWWTLHRWIGLGLTVLLVPIAVSGALLVWHDPLDALLHPSRYAVTGTQLTQPSAYLASATAALDGSAQPVGVVSSIGAMLPRPGNGSRPKNRA